MGKEYKNSMEYDALHALLSTIDLKLVCKPFCLYLIIDFLIKKLLIRKHATAFRNNTCIESNTRIYYV